jgi:hypothetical protein
MTVRLIVAKHEPEDVERKIGTLKSLAALSKLLYS